MTTVERMEDEIYLRWWGLLRRPPIHLDARLRRVELVAVGLWAGVVLAGVWALTAVLAGPVAAWLAARTDLMIGVPVGALLVPALLGALCPLRFVEGGPLHDWLLAVRYRGGLRTVDTLLALLALLSLLLVVARSTAASAAMLGVPLLRPLPAAVALIVLAAGTSIASTISFWLPAMPFLSRGRTARLPRWITTLEDEDLDANDDAADADATFRYPFPSPENTLRQVGVRIAPDVLAVLRRINAESGGCLYQRDLPNGTLAVVLGLSPPVDGAGVEEMKRLARQMLRSSRSEGWTSYQLANHVLHFVQRNIRYVRDEDSTKGILGTPYVEYGRFPLETLHDGEGDCECSSLLCAALLSYLGFRTAILFSRVPATPFSPAGGHVAIALLAEENVHPPLAEGVAPFFVHQGRRYLYGETATDSPDPEGFGAIPAIWRDRISIEKVVDVPAHPGEVGRRPA